MIDGTYNVEAKTPLGKKAGTIVLATEDNVCNAELSVAGKTAHLKGTVDGENVTFEGSTKMPFPFGKVNYTLVGTVEGDNLHGTCKTKKFSFEINGTRVS
jgi:hypothetical protein